jgi:hypothetical protein
MDEKTPESLSGSGRLTLDSQAVQWHLAANPHAITI